ncbi:MAG: putative colanic acid biosynthesis glycosyl transferase [Acidimicrobiales bacterium]|nr:putative colanic acid biosynthesis glycosyl transferase [Acidimicrobiales bacterium]
MRAVAAVLHYVEGWLPLSQGFVHAHVTRSRHRRIVVSRQPIEHLAAFPVRPRPLSLAPIDRLPAAVRPRSLTTALAALAVAGRAGVLHVHFGTRVQDVRAVVRRLRLPLVVSLHGFDATSLPRHHPTLYEPVLELVSTVIVPSRFLADRAEALGFPAERILVVPAGIDTDAFPPTPLPEGPPVVGFVGRLVEKKGIDVLAAAWPEVLARVPDARLVALGDGPLRSLLESLPATTLVEPDPHRRVDQVREVLWAATVVASPSHTGPDGDAESLLLVNLEAQAAGRPVVTTRHGGIPEFVDDGGSALVVPEADPAALAHALVRVLDDRALAARLGGAGPAVAARFDVAASVARVDDLYDRLLSLGRK